MRGESNIKVIKPYYFLYLGLSGFLLGIALGYFWTWSFFYFYLLFLTLFLGYYFFRWSGFLFFLVVISGCWLGIARWQQIKNYFPALSQQLAFDQNLTLTVKVVTETDIRVDRQLLTVSPFDHSTNKYFSQKILITAPLYPSYQYGDILQLAGKLKQPAVFSDFDYAAYLERFGIVAVVYYPAIKYIGREENILSKLLLVKNNLIDRVNRLLPEPEAAFLNGLLWGAKRSIPATVLKQFNLTGTTHIVALSGYNITVLGLIVFFIAPWFGIHRKFAFWLVVIMVVIFIFLTGYSASVVRAGIMGIAVLVAYRWGGGVKPAILLLASAAIMCAVNPYILILDVGFQLSFLATIGLIYLVPWLEKFLHFLPYKLGIKESVLATTAAMIMTTPLIVYQFGRLSLVSLLVNVLILFVIPLVMAGGFLAVIISYIIQPLGQLIAWLTYLGLHYIIVITEFFSRWRLVALVIDKPHIVWIGLVYLFIFLFIFYEQRKKTSLV